MRPQSVKHRLHALFALVSLLTVFASPLVAQDTPTIEPDATAEANDEPIEMTFGAGPFDLLQTTTGLSALSSYQATLILSFDGTKDGRPQVSSRTYTMRVDENAVREMTTELAGDPANRRWMLEINNTLYERRGEGVCRARVIEPGNTLVERWEPAGFLDSVIGADEAGSETVNAVATDHYTFDEAALGLLGSADSSGELWIASEGGFLVRYLVETTSGADYFGAGIEGTLTWDYQLTDVNQPLALELPEDCPTGILDAPVLPDATEIARFPGMTTYTTATTLADATAFYEAQFAALGIESSFPATVDETFALLEYEQDEMAITVAITVAITREDETTNVMIAGSIPPRVEPTNLVLSAEIGGQTVNLPVLPDATDDFESPDGIGYRTLTSVQEAGAFYQQAFAALGAVVTTPLADFGGLIVVEYGLGDQLIGLTIQATVEGSNSVTIRIDPPGSFRGSGGSPIVILPTADPNFVAAPPGACITAIADLPLLPDASGVLRMQGLISYNTATSITDAAAFYEAQVAAAGGQISSAIPASDMMAMLDVVQGGEAASIIIQNMGGLNAIYISLFGTGIPGGSADCATPAPAATLAGVAPGADTAPAACSVSTATTANQRSGPGTTFALAGTLTSGVPASVIGQANGTDGFVWWELGEGVWVRSDIVEAVGSCEGVPVVQP